MIKMDQALAPDKKRDAFNPSSGLSSANPENEVYRD